MVDARLPDGSRVNAVITPVAIDGTSLTIRKFPEISLTIQDLINFNSLSPYMADFLEACVHSKLNIIICGGTSSGKTTTLNILSAFIPAGERIVTIEDSAELQLQQEHVVRLETQPPDTDGEGEVPIRKLVRNALRMRPDRVIIGEVRGGEALDLLQAMNTGHDGSLTTLHGNAPREAIARLETLAMFAGFDLPVQVIRKQVASAVDVIVQQNRLRDGSRKITSIAEVVGLEGETIVMTEIFKFEEKGIGEEGSVLGEFRPSGIRPMFENRLIAAGFRLPPEVFGADKIRLRAKSDRRR
jgi:pilus assembly protein CpaF